MPTTIPGRRRWTLLLRTAFALFPVALAACGGPSSEETARAKELWDTCVQCHGDQGQGDQGKGAPNIAGLPAWYVELQLWEFQVGYRAYEPGDTMALQMAAVASSLPQPGDPALLGQFVSKLPPVVPEATLGGDPAAGKVAYQACISCHERDGSGRLDKHAPPITGLADWYFVDQIQKFRDGVRGKNPNDQLGGTMMRPVSIPLSDEDMTNLAAYVATLR